VSRAFVKEDGNDLAPLPDLPLSPHPNFVTPSGLAQLKSRLAARQADLAALRARADRLDRLPEAAAERDIRYLEARLTTANLVTAPPVTRVGFGHVVVVVDAAGHQTRYEIVGEDEADAGLNRITPFSPLGRALIGAEPGDLVTWPRRTGPVEIEVLGIKRRD
jgi:transcription elongation factor GreB